MKAKDFMLHQPENNYIVGLFSKIPSSNKCIHGWMTHYSVLIWHTVNINNCVYELTISDIFS